MHAGTQITQWDFQNKRTRTSPARLFSVLKLPLRYLRPSIIYSVPCDWIMQRVLFQDTDKMISIRANLFQLNRLTSEGQTSNLKLHLDVCDKYRTILGCSSSRLIECVHSSSSDKSNLFTSDHQTFLGDNSGF